MPFYDYECKDCGHEFEALVKDSDEKVECRDCASMSTIRQASAPSGLTFNGQGFYETEHGSQKHNRNK